MRGEGTPAWPGGVTALNVDQSRLHLCHFCWGMARGEGTQARDTVPGLCLLLTGFDFCSKARGKKLGSTFKSKAVPRRAPACPHPTGAGQCWHWGVTEMVSQTLPRGKLAMEKT